MLGSVLPPPPVPLPPHHSNFDDNPIVFCGLGELTIPKIAANLFASFLMVEFPFDGGSVSKNPRDELISNAAPCL